MLELQFKSAPYFSTFVNEYAYAQVVHNHKIYTRGFPNFCLFKKMSSVRNRNLSATCPLTSSVTTGGRMATRTLTFALHLSHFSIWASLPRSCSCRARQRMCLCAKLFSPANENRWSANERGTTPVDSGAGGREGRGEESVEKE